MPNISIIIPVYNVTQYISRCLDSIISQSYRDFEVIIVCDGPEDDMQICEKYVDKNNKFTLIKNINKGLGGARNAGIRKATGKWLSFIDADDWIEPNFLEKMLETAESDNEVDIVQCGTCIVFEYPVDKQLEKNDNAYFAINVTGVKNITENIYGSVNVGVWNKLYRKSLIDHYQLFFPEKMCNEDACFTWCFWACCRKIAYIKDKLYNYVRRKNSLMNQTFEKKMGEKVLDHLKIEDIFYSFLKKNNLFHCMKYGFWRSYEVSWWFINSNANEEYKEKGFYYAKKFLSNKYIPDEFKLLNKIKNINYTEFINNNISLDMVKVFGFPIIKKIKCKEYKKIIFFNILKIKYKNKKNLHKEDGYSIIGNNNKIIIRSDIGDNILEKWEKIDGLNIIIHGNNNIVIINTPYNFCNAEINIHSSNSEIFFGKNSIFHWVVKTDGGNNQKFIWGDNSTTSWYGECHLIEENSKVIIGNDVMFAGHVTLFASDAHAIFDIETKKCINKQQKELKIGNHVWVATGAFFTKNAYIPDNCIVGARSVVTKKFIEQHTIIAGNPAKVIKNNVIWDKRAPTSFL